MPETGEIKMFAFARPVETDQAIVKLRKKGWMACEGQSVLQRGSQGLPRLFEALGMSWGSIDPPNSFNVPDLRGRFPRGWDHDAGHDADIADRKVEPNSPGNNTSVGTFQEDAVQKHIHSDTGHSHNLIDGSTPYNEVSVAPNPPQILVLANRQTMARTGQGKANLTGPIDPTSGRALREGLETHPKNCYVMFCIYTGARLPKNISFFYRKPARIAAKIGRGRSGRRRVEAVPR